MRVRQRPNVQVSRSLGEIDGTDLEAIRLASDWGWTGRQEVRYVKPAPCEREHCGGSHVVGFTGCMLCGR